MDVPVDPCGVLAVPCPCALRLWKQQCLQAGSKVHQWQKTCHVAVFSLSCSQFLTKSILLFPINDKTARVYRGGNGTGQCLLHPRTCKWLGSLGRAVF